MSPEAGEPASVPAALDVIEAALDFLNGPDAKSLPVPVLGETLERMSVIGSKYSAAWTALLSRFDANDGHDSDGYQTTASWLSSKTQTTVTDARGQVKRMRQMAGRPLLDAATAAGLLSQSWAAQIIRWSQPLPPEFYEDLDRLLLVSVEQGALLEDLGLIIRRFIEEWKKTRPDPDDPDDGFGDRRVNLDHTFGGAGRLTGDLTPECAAAWQAIFDSLGKKRGQEDTRTQGQRFHDAMQEAAELLLRAKLVPDRAGADTRIDAVMSLAGLRDLDGAGLVEDAWLASGAEAGHHIFVSGAAADAISCDALITPVVTGGADWPVIGQIVDLLLDALDGHAPPHRDDAVPAPGLPPKPEALPLSPAAWRALLHEIARLSVGFVSGPGGLASALRTNLMPAPWNSRSVPIDVGWSASIPEAVRRAVMLRDRTCRWPGCDRRPSVCDVHHIRHKKDGGPTSVRDCVMLCQFHHDICIHRWGWKIELLPNGELHAYGPYGQVLAGHPPPGARHPATTGPLARSPDPVTMAPGGPPWLR